MEVHTIHFESIESTNNWAKQQARTFDPEKMTCILADVQTAGRGCYAKHWISKKGNLTMSLFFHLRKNDPFIPYLAQLLSYSTYQVLKREKIDVKIKWPNDLLVGNKKLCGVLAETIIFDTTIGIVIGIGLNVNVPVETNQPTTSLIEITGHPWDLKDLIAKITAQFQKDLELDFTHFQDLYNKLVSGTTIKSG
ncbi:MAG: biotin--[acetyl-CoA-carboxylase] ligase [Verrucomicrobia bacterium]|nr:biotin--[acetyl-CoA-carboxylase] ligase [Verrucomicrobiota bacterium]